MGRPVRLSKDEIAAAFNNDAMRTAFPPILSPEQFAQLWGVPRSTIYHWISQGLFEGAVTHVGKHLRLWRDCAIEILFNKYKPKNPNTNSPKPRR